VLAVTQKRKFPEAPPGLSEEDAVKLYAQARLQELVVAGGRGAQSGLGREGLKGSHIHGITKRGVKPGETAQREIAKLLGITYFELQQQALAWAGLSTGRTRRRTLAAHPRWLQIVEDARRLAPAIPDWAFIEVGETTWGEDGCPENLDVLFVLNLAHEAVRMDTKHTPQPKPPPPPAAPPPQPPPREAGKSGTRRNEHAVAAGTSVVRRRTGK
jgi:hypothetical protein